jgi:hypothetical protein
MQVQLQLMCGEPFNLNAEQNVWIDNMILYNKKSATADFLL